ASASCQHERRRALPGGDRARSGRPESVRIYTETPLPSDEVLGKGAARLGYRVRPFGGVDVTVSVDGHTLARRALIHPVVAFERRDEPGDAVFVDRTDPDAVTPVRVVVRGRLRVNHVDRIALDEE